MMFFLGFAGAFIMGQTWAIRFQAKPTLENALASIDDDWKLRLVDGLPAFPDEILPSDFNEIRLALCGSMVTVVSESFGYRLVTWSNISPEFHEAVNRLAETLARAGNGTILLEG